MDKAFAKLRQLSVDSWLAILTCVLGILLVLEMGSCLSAASLGQRVIEASVESKPAVSREEVSDVKEYEVLTEKGHFGKKQSPPKLRLFGVLGDSALIGQSDRDAKPYSEGAKLPDGSKLVEIKLDSVVVEKDEKKQTMEVFANVPEQGGNRHRGQHHGGPPTPRGPRPGPPPDASPSGGREIVGGQAPAPMRSRRMEGEMPPGMPEELKQRLMEDGLDEEARRQIEQKMRQRMMELRESGR